MRFLCLHGMGTNSRILEAQIVGICARLEGHDFVFVEGEVECDAADGLSILLPLLQLNIKLAMKISAKLFLAD